MVRVEPVAGAIQPSSSSAPRKQESESGFAATLEQAWRSLDQEIKSADRASEAFAAGSGGDIHEVMILTEKADLSFRLAAAVRNKLLEAYREIMRIQV